MKKKYLKCLLLPLVLFFALPACNDDDDTDTDGPKSNAELIIGEWAAAEARFYAYNTSTNDTTRNDTLGNGFRTYIFEEGGSYQQIEYEDTTGGSYAVDGNMLTISNEAGTNEYEIVELSDFILRFHLEEVHGEDRYEEYWELEKH